MTADFDALRRRLAEQMDQRGLFFDTPWLRAAFDKAPRHLFVPDEIWRVRGRAYRPLRRADDEQQWAEEVYGDPLAPTITQVDDGHPDPPGEGQWPTSSASCPAAVMDMLDSLDLDPGHRVLEIGTGTGWNAALLSERAGAENVVTIEIDPGLADTARDTLHQVGQHPTVVCADGEKGWPDGASFDRVIATCAVYQVPYAWVEQTRPGGIIVTPFASTLVCDDGLACLQVGEDGTASGHFHGGLRFMRMRSQRWDQSTLTGVDFEEDDATPVTRDLAPLEEGGHLTMALAFQLPGVVWERTGGDWWFHDGTGPAGSWACVFPWSEGRRVFQSGPRRLWDGIEQAWDWWMGAGEPRLWDFGLTVTSERQWVWCRDPKAGPRWAVGGGG
jgi:protein-L-isoaspartate O-methyltransferase